MPEKRSAGEANSCGTWRSTGRPCALPSAQRRSNDDPPGAERDSGILALRAAERRLDRPGEQLRENAQAWVGSRPLRPASPGSRSSTSRALALSALTGAAPSPRAAFRRGEAVHFGQPSSVEHRCARNVPVGPLPVDRPRHRRHGPRRSRSPKPAGEEGGDLAVVFDDVENAHVVSASHFPPWAMSGGPQAVARGLREGLRG